MNGPYERLFQLVPLIGETGTTIRERILLNLGVAALRAHDRPTITPDEVVSEWKSLGIGGMKTATAEDALALLVKAKALHRKGRESYEVLTLPQHTTVGDAVAESFKDFQSRLAAEIPTYDPYLDKAAQKGFRGCVDRLFEMTIQLDTGREASQIPREKALETFGIIAKDAGFKKHRDFADVFFMFIAKPPSSFAPVQDSMLTLAVSVDYFRKGAEFARLTKEVLAGEKAFVDTNVVVQLICAETSPIHKLCDETVRVTSGLGVKLRIHEDSLQELNRLIEATKRVLEGRSGNLGWLFHENQLLIEATRLQESGTPVEEIVRGFENSRTLLTTVYGIEVDSGQEEANGADRFERTLREILDANSKFRTPESIRHDARILSCVSTMKQRDGAQSPLCMPWLITLDRSLIAADRIAAGTSPEKQSAIFVSSWLSSVLPLCEFEDVKQRLDALAEGWLQLPFVGEATLKPGQILDLLGRQAGMETDDRTAFVNEALRHPLSKELAGHVRRRESDSASAVFEKIAGDTLSELRKKVKDRDELIQRLAGVIRKLRWPSGEGESSG